MTRRLPKRGRRRKNSPQRPRATTHAAFYTTDGCADAAVGWIPALCRSPPTNAAVTAAAQTHFTCSPRDGGCSTYGVYITVSGWPARSTVCCVTTASAAAAAGCRCTHISSSGHSSRWICGGKWRHCYLLHRHSPHHNVICDSPYIALCIHFRSGCSLLEAPRASSCHTLFHALPLTADTVEADDAKPASTPVLPRTWTASSTASSAS